MPIFEEEPGDYVPDPPWSQPEEPSQEPPSGPTEAQQELWGGSFNYAPPMESPDDGGGGGSGGGNGGGGGGGEPLPDYIEQGESRPPAMFKDYGPLQVYYDQINPATGLPYGPPRVPFPWNQEIEPGSGVTYADDARQKLMAYLLDPSYLNYPGSKPLPGTSMAKLEAYYDNPDYLHWPAPSPTPPSGPAVPQPVTGPKMPIPPRGGGGGGGYGPRGDMTPEEYIRYLENRLKYGGLLRL